MRQISIRRALLTTGAVAALAAGLVAAAVLIGSQDRSAVVDAAATTVSTPAVLATTTTTTTTVVERRTLPAGTREMATASAGLTEVQVLATPPPGWDRSLSPVITPADPDPPRSALDVQRVRLPSTQEPISGRAVTAEGWLLANPTTYRPPQPLVLGVVQRQGDWLEVQLPVRPNGTSGWIRAADVQVSSTTRSVQVSLSERRLRVVDAGAVLMDVPAGIGRTATPTPTGTFTVTDLVPSTDPAGGYGPIALALDGYSEVMDAFPSENAGDAPDANAPVLAIHGTNRPSSVGAAQSNGCPRLSNADVLRLAELVPAGTPVQIWP